MLLLNPLQCLTTFKLPLFYPPNPHYGDPSQTVHQRFYETCRDILHFHETFPIVQKECSASRAYWCCWSCILVFAACLAGLCFSLVFLFGLCFSLIHHNSQCSSVNSQVCLRSFGRCCAFGTEVSPPWIQISWDVWCTRGKVLSHNGFLLWATKVRIFLVIIPTMFYHEKNQQRHQPFPTICRVNRLPRWKGKLSFEHLYFSKRSKESQI